MALVTSFPHAKTCGPIEAIMRRVILAVLCAFPHAKTCGPIEAWESGRALRIVSIFPHAKTCGPIEARTPTGSPNARDAHFRTQKRAAPLKHRKYELSSRRQCNFRTQKRAAPLKPLRRLHRPAPAPHDFRTQKRAAPLKPSSRSAPAPPGVAFPHAKTCGPIEARNRPSANGRAQDISARKNVRPH